MVITLDCFLLGDWLVLRFYESVVVLPSQISQWLFQEIRFCRNPGKKTHNLVFFTLFQQQRPNFNRLRFCQNAMVSTLPESLQMLRSGWKCKHWRQRRWTCWGKCKDTSSRIWNSKRQICLCFFLNKRGSCSLVATTVKSKTLAATILDWPQTPENCFLWLDLNDCVHGARNKYTYSAQRPCHWPLTITTHRWLHKYSPILQAWAAQNQRNSFSGSLPKHHIRKHHKVKWFVTYTLILAGTSSSWEKVVKTSSPFIREKIVCDVIDNPLNCNADFH